MRELLKTLRRREAEILRLLRRMVEMESPTSNKPAVDQFGAFLAAEWKKRGARIEILRQKNAGNHVRATLQAGRGQTESQLLILGHMDTVYPLGALAKMPFRIAQGRAFGPGTFDMKGGLTIALAAMEALRELRLTPRKTIMALWTSDEETGSDTSRAEIECAGKQSDAVFVLEPAFGLDGRAKTQRKGVGEAELIVTGRAAHAGIDPERGVNAVHEMALQIARLLEWNDPRRGITVQVNVASGGTVGNVVPEAARAMIDIRLLHATDMPLIQQKLKSLRPILPDAKIRVVGGVNRPPMERTPRIAALFAHARELSRQMGLELNEASTGGGSDGNFTAALGIPTLDGMGAAGDGAHSSREFAFVHALPERAALLAGLLLTA